jgi:hypothetical protein
MSAYPTCRPHTPPDTPQSQNPMPFSANAAACTLSSVYLELPPSITRSPGDRMSPSEATVPAVIFPAGTITHVTRGGLSAATRAAHSGRRTGMSR